METPLSDLPQRLRDLDPRTIEFIARLNEQERRNLIHVSTLSDKEISRLDQVLNLPDDEFAAGLEVMTTVVRLKWAISKSVWIIGTTAAAVIAWRQLAGLFSKG